MPIFEFIWIIRQIINIGLVSEIFERLYEKYKIWRKICFYKRKILKAIMTSWHTLRFVNFEMAWEILKKSKHRKSKIKRNTSYYYKTHRYRNASTVSFKIANKRPSKKIKLTTLSNFTSTSTESPTILNTLHSNIESSSDLVCQKSHFDTDSFLIGIDNRTSYSMTPNVEDFVTPLEKVNNTCVRGIGGMLKVEGRGTVAWDITDDKGVKHEIIIPNTYFVKGLDHRLLSPQHWSQISNDNYPTKKGTRCITYHDEVVLEWEQRKYTKTIPIDPQTNTFSFYTSPGIKKYSKHVIELEHKDKIWQCEQCLLCNRAQLHLFNHNIDEYEQEQNIQADKHLKSIPTLLTKLYDEAYNNLSAKDLNREFIRWHYRLGHLSFKKMKLLSVLGVLPRKLQDCSPPACAVYIYGGMTKRPWRSKPTKLPRTSKLQITCPGQCVSVDQMEVREEGFIAQLKGKLTKQRYKYATVFVDQFSDLSYAHLQRSITSSETVEGKLAFEAYARSMGVKIDAYHADNGRFADNLFLDNIQTAGQTITF